ncbi:hypothetical protein F442_13121 [Phytophthora nicotianae P10297]|uniref:Uncharacterized protein n=2 Tax=Phytophthora nicotianae TaxID=4792 RepID=W2YZL8_PHYNI|nr:hypothetical protein F442_13121 [Phytophthora nicotianae P10297]
MTTVYEKKFSIWFKEGKPLGLNWNLNALTVSMPPEKMTKALTWIREVIGRERTTRTQLNNLKPQLYPDGPIHIKVNYHVHMDAGDRGLCVLFPAHKQFFQFEFDNDQQQLIQEFNQTGNNDFGINVRELMSVVYATLRWGRSWKSGDGNPESHVKLWFDNTSAVAWKADVNHNTMQLGAYAVYLWQFGMNCENKGNSYSTVCGKLCEIRWYHRNSAGYDPGVNVSHAILLHGIRRFTNPVTKQQPLTAHGVSTQSEHGGFEAKWSKE